MKISGPKSRMQYRESREKSAEILRMALAHMSAQESGFHPSAFALWYEHVAGVNAPLSEVLERRLQAKQPLTDSDVLELHAKYIVGRDVEIVEGIRNRLLHLLQTTSQCVSETGSHAVKFGEALDEHTARLRSPAASDLVQKIIQELLVQTRQMCSSSTTLSRHLAASAEEVRTLTQQLREARAEAAEAIRDHLTRLLNRRGLERSVNELISRSGSLAGCVMLVVDVDDFKTINDRHGHLAGDTVLRAVAQVLLARTKGSDVPARIGGDEFAVLLPNTPLAGAMVLAEQIRTTLPHGKLRRIDQSGQIEFTLSLGVAQGEVGDSFEQLVNRADRALYSAKRAGKNRVAGATQWQLDRS
jgi:diguanylate cyclase